MRRYIFVLLIMLCVMGSSSYAQADLTEESALLWEQAISQPEDFAIACMPLTGSGQTVLYNGDRFPLASVSKLLILIAYAEQVEAGIIPQNETVSVATLERYNLPRTDRGAHDRFMERYPGATSLALFDVAVYGMIQYSSNAASDYMLDRLGDYDWDALYQSLGIFNTDFPTPLTMIPLLMNNHDTGKTTDETLNDLSAAQGEIYLSQYVSDETWRQEEISYRSQGTAFIDRRGSVWPDWDIQAAILQDYTATGNVNDFRNVMRAIYSENSVLSPGVRYMARTALQWTENQFINDNYVEFGSKLGFYSGGTLTLLAYGNAYSGTPTISVIFLRNIPRRQYFEMLREDSIGDFAHWLNFNGCSALRALMDSTLDDA